MKTLHIFIIIGLVISLTFANSAYAMPPFDSQQIYDFSNTIVLGKVVSVDSNFSPTHNLYEIKVEKFLKNQQNSDVVFAVGQKTVNARLGNTVFNLNDRGLFFLMNNTIGYDTPSKFFGIYPISRLVEPEWDRCNIFAKEIPKEHWVFGGIGQMPAVRQGNNIDTKSFTVGKEILITYDVFNHSPNPKNATFGILVKNLDEPDSLYEFSEINNSYLVKPCTPYKTLTWSFTPTKSGHYMIEFYDLSGSMMGVDFVVLGDTEYPIDGKNTDAVINAIDFRAFEASKAKCTVLGFSGIEKCNLQSSLTLGIVTITIIGAVIATSMFTLRKRK